MSLVTLFLFLCLYTNDYIVHEPDPEFERDASSPLSDLPDLPDELEFSPPPSRGPSGPSRSRQRQQSSNVDMSIGTGLDKEVDRDSSLTPLYDHDEGEDEPRSRSRAESSAAGARRSASISNLNANANKRGGNKDSRDRENQGRTRGLLLSSSPPLESIEVAPDISPPLAHVQSSSSRMTTTGAAEAGGKKRQRGRPSKETLALRHMREHGNGPADGEGDSEIELVPKPTKRSKSSHPFSSSHASSSHPASSQPSRKPLDPISTGLKLPGPRALPPSRPRALNDQSIKKILVGKTEEVQLGVCLRERYKKWGKCTQCVSKLGGDCCRFRDYRVFP